jgi:phosphoglycolate phosphatase
MKYNVYLFDLDGTLLDTSEGVVNALNQICERLNIQKITKNQAKKFLGPPLDQVILNMYPQAAKEEVEVGVAIYKEYYTRRGIYEAKIYDGILRLLQYLKGRSAGLAVVSLKYQEAVEQSLKHFKLEKYFDLIFGADIYGKLTKYDLIEKCLGKLGVIDRREVALIGDSPYDAEGARRSGIDFIAVSYGFGFTKESSKDYKSGVDHFIS